MAERKQFNLAETALDNLSAQLAASQRELAVTRAQLAEAKQFIQDHAEQLGLQAGSEETTQSSNGKATNVETRPWNGSSHAVVEESQETTQK